MNRDILSCSNVANRDVFFFVRNGPNSDVTGKANSGMFIGMLSTYASHRSVWVVSACTRIYPAGLYQAQHKRQRIRVVQLVPRVCTLSRNGKCCHTVWHAMACV